MRITEEIVLDLICTECDSSAVGFNDDGGPVCDEHLLPDVGYTNV